MLIARNVVSLKTESILAVLLRSLAHTVFYFCVPALFMEEVCINLRMSSRACRILCNNIQNVFFSPQGCEAEKGSEASPGFGYPKTCQECWQTEVQKVSCVK